MLQKEQLEAMKVDELRKVFKENGISYYKNSKRMTKTEMIERYLEETTKGDKIDANTEKHIKNADKTDKKVEQPVKTAEQIAEEEAEKAERKKKYVEQAKVGTIVAFKLPSGKVISAAITRKSTKGRKFMVETKYGAEHKISFDDVLWVRTNKRWPKGIYLLFKKNIKVEVSKDGEEIS